MSRKHDVYCKECGCQMRVRRGKYGNFWGCTGYPICKNTMSVRDAMLHEEPEEVEREPD